MMHAFLSSLVPLALSLVPQEASTLVRYDLKPVMPRFDAGGGWAESLVPQVASPYDEDPVPFTELEGLYESPPPEVVLDVVTRILGDDMLQQGRVVQLEGESELVVLAPPSMHTKIRSILETLSSAFAAAAQGGATCAERGAVIEQLRKGYGEHRHSLGLQPNGGVIETFANPETGSWTIIVSLPSGLSCMLAAGEAFEAVEGEAPTGAEGA